MMIISYDEKRHYFRNINSEIHMYNSQNMLCLDKNNAKSLCANFDVSIPRDDDPNKMVTGEETTHVHHAKKTIIMDDNWWLSWY